MITKFKIDVSISGKQDVSILRKQLDAARPRWSKLLCWKVVRQGHRNPKSKGNQGERDIAKMLSLWWSEGKSEEIFTRQDGSGAKIHRAKNKKWVGGDIKAIGIDGIDFTEFVSVEVKNVYDVDMYRAINGKGVFWAYWEQANGDADKAKKQPWLIFKQKSGVWMIALRRQLFYFLESYYGMYRFPFSILHNDEEKCAVCALDDFFDWSGDGVAEMIRSCQTLLEELVDD